MVRAAGLPTEARVVSSGRPTWWTLLAALVVGGLVTADLLTRGALERMDLWVSEIVSDWDLENSVAYPVVWLVT